MKRPKYVSIAVALAMLVSGCAIVHPAHAVPRGRRAHHAANYHYPAHGHVVKVLPAGRVALVLKGRPYYYASGVFYRPAARRGFVVVAAPIGAVVRVLPRGFVTVYAGSRPYYFANHTYFLWDPMQAGYVVVEEPEGVTDEPSQLVAVTSSELFVYPKNGQGEEDQARDRYECHMWAVHQAGFDPSLGEPGANGAHSNYQRAITACLDARGYTVR